MKALIIYKSVHLWTILFLVFIDQTSKYLFRVLTLKSGAIEVLDLFHIVHIHIVHVWNSGISFGIGSSFKHSNVLFGIITVTIICLLSYLRYNIRNGKIFISLIIAGALGNLVDRLIFGAVYDFIDLSIGTFHWPAFNLADTVIFVGSLLFVLFAL